MGTMAREQPRARRSFTPEFTAEIVELCRCAGTSRSVRYLSPDRDRGAAGPGRQPRIHVDLAGGGAGTAVVASAVVLAAGVARERSQRCRLSRGASIVPAMWSGVCPA
jgi:hypothetical protein